MADDFLTLDALGQRLNVTERTIRRMHRDYGLPLHRVGDRGLTYAYWSEVRRWLKAQETGTTRRVLSRDKSRI